MKHPSNLQIAMSKSSGLAEGTKGQGEDPPSRFWQIRQAYSNQRDRLYPSHHNLPPWILKPYYGVDLITLRVWGLNEN